MELEKYGTNRCWRAFALYNNSRMEAQKSTWLIYNARSENRIPSPPELIKRDVVTRDEEVLQQGKAARTSDCFVLRSSELSCADWDTNGTGT